MNTITIPGNPMLNYYQAEERRREAQKPRHHQTITSNQQKILQSWFARNPFPSNSDWKDIESSLGSPGLSIPTIRAWFETNRWNSGVLGTMHIHSPPEPPVGYTVRKDPQGCTIASPVGSHASTGIPVYTPPPPLISHSHYAGPTNHRAPTSPTKSSFWPATSSTPSFPLPAPHPLNANAGTAPKPMPLTTYNFTPTCSTTSPIKDRYYLGSPAPLHYVDDIDMDYQDSSIHSETSSSASSSGSPDRVIRASERFYAEEGSPCRSSSSRSSSVSSGRTVTLASQSLAKRAQAQAQAGGVSKAKAKVPANVGSIVSLHGRNTIVGEKDAEVVVAAGALVSMNWGYCPTPSYK